jgi:hypothetical protein
MAMKTSCLGPVSFTRVRTPREINHCADVLAKQGICKAEEFVAWL